MSSINLPTSSPAMSRDEFIQTLGGPERFSNYRVHFITVEPPRMRNGRSTTARYTYTISTINSIVTGQAEKFLQNLFQTFCPRLLKLTRRSQHDHNRLPTSVVRKRCETLSYLRSPSGGRGKCPGRGSLASISWKDATLLLRL